MSDSDHPNPNPPPSPATADEPELQDQVDQLLDEVEALTKETLGENEPAEARAPADVPTTDPAKEIAADDVGLSSESPLVQDGERTSVEEVAADVDQELDAMEKLISGIGSSTSSADSGTPDPTDAAVAVPAEAPDPEPPADAENPTASDVDVSESIEDQQAAPEPAVDADSDSTPPASADAPAEDTSVDEDIAELVAATLDAEQPADAENTTASDVDLTGNIEQEQTESEPAADSEDDPIASAPAEDASLDEDIAEIVAASLGPESPTEPEALIADQIPSDPEDLQAPESPKETSLDEDLDALLASTEVAEDAEVADLEAPIEDVSSPADLETPPATTDKVVQKPEAAPLADIDLESVPIWRVVKFKLKAGTRNLAGLVRRRAIDALVWLLERVDAKVGKKLSPMIREMVGYCALATLAMSIIALIIFLI